jgi:hypothetical protein
MAQIKLLEFISIKILNLLQFSIFPLENELKYKPINVSTSQMLNQPVNTPIKLITSSLIYHQKSHRVQFNDVENKKQ